MAALVAVFVDGLSWPEVSRRVQVDERTLRRWSGRFSIAVRGGWLTTFTSSLALQPQTFALPQSAEASPERAIVALAAAGLSFREKVLYGSSLKPELLLSRLWLWGFRTLRRALFPSTCNAQGERSGRRLNKGPPI